MSDYNLNSETEFDNERDFEFIPSGYGVKVKLDPIQEKIGMLYVTDERKSYMRHQQKYGTVVELGPDCYTHPKYNGRAWCKVGDRVIVPPDCAALFFTENGIDYKCVNDEDIKMVGRKIERVKEETKAL